MYRFIDTRVSAFQVSVCHVLSGLCSANCSIKEACSAVQELPVMHGVVSVSTEGYKLVHVSYAKRLHAVAVMQSWCHFCGNIPQHQDALHIVVNL